MFEELKREYDKKYNEELNKTGIFWAFNRNQFDENKTYKNSNNNEYLYIGAGGYIHKSDKDKFDNFFKVVAPKLKEEFTKKIKIEDLIKYELINHECYYIGDFSLAVFAIKDYYPNMSNDLIIKKVKEIYDNSINKDISI